MRAYLHHLKSFVVRPAVKHTWYRITASNPSMTSHLVTCNHTLHLYLRGSTLLPEHVNHQLPHTILGVANIYPLLVRHIVKTVSGSGGGGEGGLQMTCTC